MPLPARGDQQCHTVWMQRIPLYHFKFVLARLIPTLAYSGASWAASRSFFSCSDSGPASSRPSSSWSRPFARHSHSQRSFFLRAVCIFAAASLSFQYLIMCWFYSAEAIPARTLTFPHLELFLALASSSQAQSDTCPMVGPGMDKTRTKEPLASPPCHFLTFKRFSGVMVNVHICRPSLASWFLFILSNVFIPDSKQ